MYIQTSLRTQVKEEAEIIKRVLKEQEGEDGGVMTDVGWDHWKRKGHKHAVSAAGSDTFLPKQYPALGVCFCLFGRVFKLWVLLAKDVSRSVNTKITFVKRPEWFLFLLWRDSVSVKVSQVTRRHWHGISVVHSDSCLQASASDSGQQYVLSSGSLRRSPDKASAAEL